MAENKKSFLLYCDLIHTVTQMPNDKAGELFKHILEYVNDNQPTTEDLIIKLTFEPIKQSLKRDLDKWSKEVSERSYNGRIGNLKRWHLDLYNKVISNELTIDIAEKISINRKASLSDSTLSTPIANIAVSDSVSVSVNDKDIEKNKKEYTSTPFSFFNSLLSLGAEKQFINEWIKVRKNKKLTNTETALKLFLNQVEKSGHTLNEVLEKCIEKSWGGFESDWYSKNTNEIFKCEFKNHLGKIYKKMTEAEIVEFTKSGVFTLCSKEKL